MKKRKQVFYHSLIGVWVTAYARNNLLRNVIKLDDYVIYCDTDSIKLVEGYDKSVIDEYNKFVEGKIKYVSEKLEIPIEKYSPKDCFGEPHTLGLFDKDAHYEKFITQGAKKYAYYKYIKKSKIKKDSNVIKLEDEKALVLEITVSGVPKSRSKSIEKN